MIRVGRLPLQARPPHPDTKRSENTKRGNIENQNQRNTDVKDPVHLQEVT